MSMFKYYATRTKGPPPGPAMAVHTNFLRTGKIIRYAEDWVQEERRYLSDKEVAERTGRRLEHAGRKTHQRLNRFHQNIRFPEIIFHKTLATAPHLGYVHVTASKTDFADHKDVTWGFYIANFTASINVDTGEDTNDEKFFHRVKPGYARMYFAVAMKDGEGDGARSRRQVINRDVGENGVLFRTADPKAALRNVLMLGARNAELRKIVAAIV
ncbi:DUF6656 family protein [Hoeflea olei]|uniref:Uncharacterized protein n=1 Tax=Hoeflea olei TaxID=1480615 RepID=A0A1C1YWG8_9HYPH|nr:DUF6656 family protein [Hoeflea olei]OCW57769.1 hypothetical protein AWJ14_02920 [Hoeflea olei]